MTIFRFDDAFTYDDLMLVPSFSSIKSRKEPDTTTLLGAEVLSVPIVSAPMNTVTESEMAQTLAAIGADSVMHRYLSVDDTAKEFRAIKGARKPWVAIGASGDYVQRAETLFRKGATKFCVDVANGHSEHCIKAVITLREKFGESIQIMAGNVCTAEGAETLETAGANVIRVGIGPGSMCTTRLVTGFGVPQLTAVKWCSEAVMKASIVADGGIRTSGDIVKALAAGADAVMIGGLLAGTKETPGDLYWDEEEKRHYKHYHGMASREGREEYFSKEDTAYVPEGVSTKVWLKGSAVEIVENLNSSLKVGMSFANARNLKELRANARWIRVSDNGRVEGTPNKKLHK